MERRLVMLRDWRNRGLVSAAAYDQLRAQATRWYGNLLFGVAPPPPAEPALHQPPARTPAPVCTARHGRSVALTNANISAAIR
jgi:hypothetical protein